MPTQSDINNQTICLKVSKSLLADFRLHLKQEAVLGRKHTVSGYLRELLEDDLRDVREFARSQGDNTINYARRASGEQE